MIITVGPGPNIVETFNLQISKTYRHYGKPIPSNMNRKEFGRWLSGFIDGEGCFHVRFNGKSLNFTFTIALHIDDIDVLYKIRDFLGVGTVWKSRTQSTCSFRIRGITQCIASLIPLLNEFPLLTKKYWDFKIFEKLIYLKISLKKREKLSKEMIDYVWSLKAEINLKNKKPNPGIYPVTKFWLLGFIEGEGTFGLKHLVPYFQLGQLNQNAGLLQEIANFIIENTASVFPFKFTTTLNKRTDVLSISNARIDALFDIAKFFMRMTFQTRKKTDFLLWAIVVYIRKYGYFFGNEGRKFVISFHKYMNKGRYRNAEAPEKVPDITKIDILEKPFEVPLIEGANHTEIAKLFSKSQGKPSIWMYDNDVLVSGRPFNRPAKVAKLIPYSGYIDNVVKRYIDTGRKYKGRFRFYSSPKLYSIMIILKKKFAEMFLTVGFFDISTPIQPVSSSFSCICTWREDCTMEVINHHEL